MSELPGFALREALREGYGSRELVRDTLAGLVVGIVALPLSMALAIAVGAAPQHGLYTAIVAGLVTALLGGSRTQVTGPTAAFVAILAPIVSKVGLAGLLLAGVFAGLLLIAMGLFRLGKLIEYIPYPVTTGFTAGIGVVIGSMQLKDLFGLHPAVKADGFIERLVGFTEARHTGSWAETSVGLGTLLLLVVSPRVARRLPAPLLALPAAGLAVAIAHHFAPSFSVATIGSAFHSQVGNQVVAGIPRLPPLPGLPWLFHGGGDPPLALDWTLLRNLILPAAFAIAMLGAIESLLSAVVADGMAGTKHDPDAELLGLGVANLIAPFFGGIPATGAIARTATGIRNGARSPVSTAVHSVTVLLAVLVLAPALSYLPMASLAGLLLLVAGNMSDAPHVVRLVRTAPKSDVAVLLTCFLLTVVFDMVKAVAVGVVLASLLFTRRMSELSAVGQRTGQATGTPPRAPPGVVIYDIYGPLFFGAAQRAIAALGQIAGSFKVLILRMEQVPMIDSTGLAALESAFARLAHRNVLIILSDLQEQPEEALRKAGFGDRPGELLLRPSLDAALAAAGEAVGVAPAA